VAERVVDRLEPVDVEEHEQTGRAASLPVGGLGAECGPVAEAGQVVLPGLVLQGPEVGERLEAGRRLSRQQLEQLDPVRVQGDRGSRHHHQQRRLLAGGPDGQGGDGSHPGGAQRLGPHHAHGPVLAGGVARSPLGASEHAAELSL